MRELSIVDMEIVSGGFSEGDAMAMGSALGAGVALGIAEMTGASLANSTMIAGIGAAYGAGVTAAAIGGWYIGEQINNYTPIQEWIASGLDRVTHDGDTP